MNDYEDGGAPVDQTIVYQTGYQPTAHSGAAVSWRVMTGPEHVAAELAEVRAQVAEVQRRLAALESLARWTEVRAQVAELQRRVTALESLARWTHDQ